MRQFETSGVTIEQIQEMARREMSTPTRIGYLLLLMVTLLGAGLVSMLWATEPQPLPLRTQVAFGLLVTVNLAWSMLFGWVLMQRKVLFAIHRVIAGWMAVVFCSVFLLLGLAIGVIRMNPAMLTLFGIIGAVQLCAALVMLKRSQRRRHALLARRDELSSVLAQCGA